MKKYIVMSIIAVVALLPFAAWADTEGSAIATLTFTSVINTIVVDGWGDLTIDQNTTDYASVKWLAENYTGGTIDWGNPSDTDDLTVTVQSMTDFKVYGSYSGVATGFTLPTAAWLYLDAFGLKDYTAAIPHGLDDAGAALAMTLLDFAGSNTIGTSGETKNYEVMWDPSQLPALTAGDTVNLTIYFAVTDPSV